MDSYSRKRQERILLLLWWREAENLLGLLSHFTIVFDLILLQVWQLVSSQPYLQISNNLVVALSCLAKLIALMKLVRYSSLSRLRAIFALIPYFVIWVGVALIILLLGQVYLLLQYQRITIQRGFHLLSSLLLLSLFLIRYCMREEIAYLEQKLSYLY